MKKKVHIARKIFENVFAKNRKLRILSFTFLLFIIPYHWMGGKGGSPRYFNGNAPKYNHVNLVRSIGEHRYGPPKKHVSDFSTKCDAKKFEKIIIENCTK